MNMRSLIKLGLAAAMFALWSVASNAAEPVRGPVYRAPPPLPFYNWTGFYAGGHAGVGWIDGGSSGFIGGGQVGYNYQFGPNWVLGLEGDFAGTSIGTTVTSPLISASGGVDWVATLAPRFGYAFDRWLVYGKLGGAWAHSSGSVTMPFLGTISSSDTVGGWMLGVGTEYALQGNWTVKAEYNRMDFGSGSVFTDNTIHVFKAGINYRFGGPGGPF